MESKRFQSKSNDAFVQWRDKMFSRDTSILVTGSAGFIGFHVARRLLELGCQVIGIDNLNDYYDPQLKKDRLAQLVGKVGFTFETTEIADRLAIRKIFADHRPQLVIHLAAQAGVRYSLTNPHAYVESNLVGFVNILEECRHHQVRHLVYASSSSVYGSNAKLPFAVGDQVDHPISLYAATKKSNELMAHTYSHLFGLPTTGLRFFTVYGPWGRPDMAIATFSKAIVEERPIDVYNFGKMKRDFTYVDDIVDGVIQSLGNPPDTNVEKYPERNASDTIPYRIYNLGNHKSVELDYLISILEECLGKKAHRRLLPLQPGDMLDTDADIDATCLNLGYQPTTSIEEGIKSYAYWFKDYYGHADL
jgi:UDP-glucuronate 4-epimerase